MSALLHEEYPVESGDYDRAGEASADIKRKLKQLGVPATVLRRVSVASYEVELNLVIHSDGGVLTLEVTPEAVRLISADRGRASRIWIWPCARAGPPPARPPAAWASAPAWACPT